MCLHCSRCNYCIHCGQCSHCIHCSQWKPLHPQLPMQALLSACATSEQSDTEPRTPWHRSLKGKKKQKFVVQVLHPVHCTHGSRCLHCSQCAQCTHCIHCSQWNPCTHSFQFTVSNSYRRRLTSLKRKGSRIRRACFASSALHARQSLPPLQPMRPKHPLHPLQPMESLYPQFPVHRVQ